LNEGEGKGREKNAKKKRQVEKGLVVFKKKKSRDGLIARGGDVAGGVKGARWRENGAGLIATDGYFHRFATATLHP